MDGSGGKERKRDDMFRMLDRLLAFLLVAYLFFIGILPLAGLEPFGVLSGSMTPTVRAGDLVYLKRNDIHPVSTGDVIAFRLSGGNFVLHRVQRKEDGAFVTKGDANETEDFSPVAEDQVYGKMVFVLRKGAVTEHFSIWQGIFLCVEFSEKDRKGNACIALVDLISKSIFCLHCFIMLSAYNGGKGEKEKNG